MKSEKQEKDYAEKSYLINVKSYRLSLVRLIVSILAFLLTILTLTISYKSLSGRAVRVEKELLANRFSIFDPVDGATVPLERVIRGKTPFTDLNYFILVTPLKTRDDFVQDRVSVSSSGLWTGTAKFGSAGVGSGEEFMIRALGTKRTLAPGKLPAVPEDAMFSESIIVKRQ